MCFRGKYLKVLDVPKEALNFSIPSLFMATVEEYHPSELNTSWGQKQPRTNYRGFQKHRVQKVPDETAEAEGAETTRKSTAGSSCIDQIRKETC